MHVCALCITRILHLSCTGRQTSDNIGRPISHHFHVFYCFCLVLCCVMACSLWYWFIHNVNTRQTTSQSKSVLPTVTFGYSFYIIVGAGVSSVLATAINLFQSRQLNRRGNRQGTGHYSMLSISADDTESSSPPAYTP